MLCVQVFSFFCAAFVASFDVFFFLFFPVFSKKKGNLGNTIMKSSPEEIACCACKTHKRSNEKRKEANGDAFVSGPS